MTTTTSITQPPVAPIELGAAGSTSIIERLVAGMPIEVTWPGADDPLRAFLAKAIAWTYDPMVTAGELYDLVYGVENPLLIVVGSCAIVTRDTHEQPAWLLLVEAIDRKRAAVGHLDVEAARGRFTMSVNEAALALGYTPSAVRQLIATGRLTARKEGRSYLLDPASVTSFHGLRRGPLPGATRATQASAPTVVEASSPDAPSAVHVRIGHDADLHVRIKGAKIATPSKDGNALSGELEPGWSQLHVLAYSDDGKARLFVFEPAVGASLDWRFGGFYVRGAAREVSHDNNAKRARERFDTIR